VKISEAVKVDYFEHVEGKGKNLRTREILFFFGVLIAYERVDSSDVYWGIIR